MFYAASFFIAPAGAAENGAENFETVNAPVYKPGETWIYRALEKLPTGSSKSNLLNGDYELAIGQGGGVRAFAVSNDRRTRLNQPRNLIYLLPTAQVIRQSRQYFYFPLAVGKSWAAKGNNKTTADAQISVTGVETVTTMAGSFRAFRLERQLYLGKKKLKKQYFTEIYYYSPETRSVVKHHFQHDRYEFMGAPEVTAMDIELIQLPSSKPPRNANPIEPQFELPRNENSSSPQPYAAFLRVGADGATVAAFRASSCAVHLPQASSDEWSAVLSAR